MASNRAPPAPYGGAKNRSTPLLFSLAKDPWSRDHLIRTFVYEVVGLDWEIPRTAKDRIQKMLAALFRDTLTAWYDDTLPPVKDIMPSDVNLIQIQEHLLDAVFLLEDNTVLNIEHNARSFPFLGDSQEGIKRAAAFGPPGEACLSFLEPRHRVFPGRRTDTADVVCPVPKA
ncbi:MAG: hypothetical protein OWU84_08590 [Firmicutes bacterium]|nr:hypothetical protein [Bacillota bacterium]